MSVVPRSRRTSFALLLLVALGLGAGTAMTNTASAAPAHRHYYSSWSYQPQRTYYYSYYYYKPYSSYDGYRYHYSIYYPSRPRYVYYYNPVRKVYWGRYDLEEKGYSLLDEKDRKGNLDAIPEEAFPKPGAMPPIPDAEDDERMIPIDPKTLPKSEVPEDAPGK